MTERNGLPIRSFDFASEFLTASGRVPEQVLSQVASFKVEVPSWGFTRGGTRFGAYRDGSEAETIDEKIADAALVNRLTAATPTVALHFPWDGSSPEELAQLERALAREGMGAGAINSNTFSVRPAGALDYRIRLGSLTSPFADVREAAIEHHRDCLGIMRRLGSKVLSVWLPDGTNSPGQASLLEQSVLLRQGLRRIYADLRPGERMFVEYKLFEPGFYSTAIADWGKAFTLCQALGEQALVLVDLGHHPLGTNIEQIVGELAALGRLGGFHFNDKKYADDDLASGSIDPHQLFRIFLTLVEAEDRGLIKMQDLAFMIDQSHMIKHPVEEMLESVENLQRAYIQALAVDTERLQRARAAGDVTMSDAVLRSAFQDAPVNAILAEMRRRTGLPPDPIACFRQLQASGEVRKGRPIVQRVSTGLGA